MDEFKTILKSAKEKMPVYAGIDDFASLQVLQSGAKTFVKARSNGHDS